MRYNILVVVNTDGISGGRVVAKEISKVLDSDLYFLKNKEDHYNNLIGKMLIAIKLLIRLNKAINKKDYDFIIAEGLYSALFVCIIKFFKISNTKGQYKLLTRLGRRWADQDKKILWWMVYRTSDFIISPLSGNFKIWNKNKFLKVLIEKIIVVKNPISLSSSVFKLCTKERHGLLVIGRNIPAKRLPEAVAYASNLGTILNEKVYVYSDCNLDFRQFNNVKVRPFTSELWAKHYNAIALVNFAVNEGYSMVTAEAFVLGIPTISLEGFSGQNDLIKDFNVGIILENQYEYIKGQDFLENWNYVVNSEFEKESNSAFTKIIFDRIGGN